VLYDKSKANLSLMIGLSLAFIGFAGAYSCIMVEGLKLGRNSRLNAYTTFLHKLKS